MDYPVPVPGYSLISAEDANSQIEELIGISFPICTNTILFCQASRNRPIQDFIDADSATQQQIFRTLFQLDYYEESQALVSANLKKLTEELLSKRQQVRDLEFQIEEKSETIRSFEEEKKKWEDQRDSEAGLANATKLLVESQLHENNADLIRKTRQMVLEGLELRNQELAGLRDSLTKLQTELSNQVAKVHSCLTDIEKSESQISALSEPLKEPEGVPVDDSPALREKLEKVTGELAALQDYREEHISERSSISTRKEVLTTKVGHLRSQLTLCQREREAAEGIAALTRKRIAALTKCPTCQQEFATPEHKAHVAKDLQMGLDANLELLSRDDEKNLQKEIEQLTQELEVDLPQRLSEVTNTLDKIEKAVTFQNSEIREINTKLDYLRSKQEAIQLHKVRVQERARMLESEKEHLHKCKLSLKTYQELHDSLSLRVQDASAEVAQKEQRISSINSELLILNNRIERDIIPLERQLEEVKQTIQRLTTATFPLQSVLDSNSKQLRDCRTTLEKTLKEVLTLEKTHQLENDIYAAFGKDGIVGELFREYIPEIQTLADNYLSDLTNGELAIDFLPEKELKKKLDDGSRATKNQFTIQARKVRGGSAYDLISGSEQNKAALVVNWALSDLAYLESNVRSNLVVFDEIFDSLDAKGMERLAQLILKRNEGVTLVITHKVELEDVFRNKIVLEKKEGVTRIAEIR